VNKAAQDYAYNLALYRLVHADDYRVRNLAIITGLSERAIYRRCQRVAESEEKTQSPSQKEDSDLRAYMFRRYADSKDPAVQEFLLSLNNKPFADPNHPEIPA
jgi:hypothetical protein